jgi:hypothetical protein
MKLISFFALFLVLAGFPPFLHSQTAHPPANSEFQSIENDSDKIPDGRFLFGNRKILVPFQQGSKSNTPSGWTLLDPFKGLKPRGSSLYVSEFSYRELDGDLLCWYEVIYPKEGEEGYDPAYMARFSGKDMKLLWVRKIDFNLDSDAYLFEPGALYVFGSTFIDKFDLAEGDYAWKHNKNPFNGDEGTFKKPTLENGILTFRDNYKRVLTLEDSSGRILDRDYSAVPRNPVPVEEILLGTGFGSYTTYEMFQDHVDGLAWLNGGSWALGMLATALDPPRQDQSSRSSTSYLAIPGLSLAACYPAIATIVGYSTNNNDVATRGCIGLGAETVFFILWADAKENEEASKTALRPDFSPRYAGLTWSRQF